MSHSLGAGGGERQLALTALSIDRSRFQPHIACCEEGFWVERLKQAGIPFFFIGSRSLMSAAAVGEALRLRQYIRDHGIRLVQTFDYSMNVFGIPVALSAPGVVAVSNLRCQLDLIPPRYRWLNRVSFHTSARVVVNSEALGRQLQKRYHLQADKIVTCYNGIDTKVFHPGPRRRFPWLEGASLVIGTVCVMRPEKNIPLLLEAVARVAARR